MNTAGWIGVALSLAVGLIVLFLLGRAWLGWWRGCGKADRRMHRELHPKITDWNPTGYWLDNVVKIQLSLTQRIEELEIAIGNQSGINRSCLESRRDLRKRIRTMEEWSGEAHLLINAHLEAYHSSSLTTAVPRTTLEEPDTVQETSPLLDDPCDSKIVVTSEPVATGGDSTSSSPYPTGQS
jgi:hypothetical protein